MVLVAGLLFGCATIPLKNPIENIRDIKGTWQGTLMGPRGSMFNVTLTIKEDGNFEVTGLESFRGGDLQVIAGRARWIAPGSAGTMTLTEDRGRPVLELIGDGGLWGGPLRRPE